MIQPYRSLSANRGLKKREAGLLNRQMASRFGQWLTSQQYSKSTTDHYMSVVRKLCDYLGDRSLATVTPFDIGDFLHHFNGRGARITQFSNALVALRYRFP